MGKAEWEEETHYFDIASQDADTFVAVSDPFAGDGNAGYIDPTQETDTGYSHTYDTSTTGYTHTYDSDTFSGYTNTSLVKDTTDSYISNTNTTLVKDTTDSYTSNTNTLKDVSNTKDCDLSQVCDLRQVNDLPVNPKGTMMSQNLSIVDLHSYQCHISDKNNLNNNTESYNYNYNADISNSEGKVVDICNVGSKNEGGNDNNTQEEELTPSKKTRCNVSPFFRQMMAVFIVSGMGAAIGTVSSFPAVAIPQWSSGSHTFTDDQAKWFE